MPSKSESAISNMKKPELLAYAISISEEHTDLKTSVGDRLGRIEDDLIKTRKDNASLLADNSSLRADNVILNEKLSKLEGNMISIERNSNGNAQYARNRQLEMWNLPAATTDADDLKTEAAKLLSLTGANVKAVDIDVAHKIKRQGSIIVEFASRTKRNQVVMARKELKHKKADLAKASCPKMSVVESMTWEFKRLDFVCRKLKELKKITETWFFMGKLNLVELGTKRHFISHITELYSIFGKEEIDEILAKPSDKA
jgi:hypothetical protein